MAVGWGKKSFSIFGCIDIPLGEGTYVVPPKSIKE
jgi:hypothetical protein